MKLLSLATTSTSGGQPVTFVGPEMYTLVAFLAFGVILTSLINLLAFNDWSIPTTLFCARWSLYLVGCCLMALLLVIILITAEEVQSDHLAMVYLFSLLWLGYPVVTLASSFNWLSFYDADVAYAVLDVASKGAFAIWVVQKTFYP